MDKFMSVLQVDEDSIIPALDKLSDVVNSLTKEQIKELLEHQPINAIEAAVYGAFKHMIDEIMLDESTLIHDLKNMCSSRTYPAVNNYRVYRAYYGK